jgi:TetR/AcrR family transcriptional regulator, cholesterol catabolism regulator
MMAKARAVTPSAAPEGGRLQTRREEIIQEAAKLFDRDGYRAATLDDLAAAVGLAKPTLYHYFPTKDAILYAIHDEFQAEITRRKAIRDAKSGTAAEQLAYLITDIVELTDEMPRHTSIFLELERELTPKQRSRVLKRRKAFTDEVKAMVAEGIEAGEFVQADPSMLAMAMLGMASWTYKWFRPNGRYTSTEIAQQFVKFITDGIVRKDASRRD